MQILFKTLSISLLSSIAFSPDVVAHTNLGGVSGKFSLQECSVSDLELPEDFVVYAAANFAGVELNYTIDRTSNQSGEVIDVIVNSPSKPVILILADHKPSIWDIGWTEDTEIIGVFATGYHRQAVAGLPKETPVKISTLQNQDECGYITNKHMPELELSLQALSEVIFEQEIEEFFYKEGIVGEPIAKEELENQELFTSDDTPVESFYSSNSLKTGQAAIEEALAKGQLRPATEADVNAWVEAQRKLQPEKDFHPVPLSERDNISAFLEEDRWFEFYVVTSEDFVYPPGLTGGSASFRFFIPQGMSRPQNDPGWSVIYDINMGTCNDGNDGAMCKFMTMDR